MVYFRLFITEHYNSTYIKFISIQLYYLSDQKAVTIKSSDEKCGNCCRVLLHKTEDTNSCCIRTEVVAGLGWAWGSMAKCLLRVWMERRQVLLLKRAVSTEAGADHTERL